MAYTEWNVIYVQYLLPSAFLVSSKDYGPNYYKFYIATSNQIEIKSIPEPGARSRLDHEKCGNVDFQSSLLENLPFGSLGDGLARLDAASRQIPLTGARRLRLLHHQYGTFVVDQDGRNDETQVLLWNRRFSWFFRINARMCATNYFIMYIRPDVCTYIIK